MHLLNTTTYKLHDFVDVERVPNGYAILSHRWGEEEVSYQDYVNGRYHEEAQGYKKIKSCCDFARGNGQEWVWIDTCCLDKSSSHEMTEGVNAMFEWYMLHLA
jgi:hypothetical protein